LVCLSREDRAHRAFELKMRGMPITTIAEMLGVNRSTIHSDLRTHTEMFRESFEGVPAANIIAEGVAFLDEIEMVCLREISGPQDDEIVDLATNTVTKRKSGNDSDRNQWVKSLLKAREMKTKLLMDTGVIPKVPERLWHKLTDSRVDDKADDRDTRTREQIIDDIQDSVLPNTKSL